tara:strand:+ start:150 stop:920 length:771 start_codon:yes stop_codon:yes gene_type:complete
MKALSICSGADGFGLAAQLLGIEVIAHIELDPVFDEHYKRHWPNAKRFYDLRATDPAQIPAFNIAFGGEPCQGNSVAGKRKGTEDDRYLWPDYFRICKASRPDWIINENVAGSVSNMVLDTKIADLESEGYTCRAFNIPAHAVNAFHERQRIFLVAHSKRKGCPFNQNLFREPGSWPDTFPEWDTERFPWSPPNQQVRNHAAGNVSGRLRPIPLVGLQPVANDVPQELAELKAYGNAVVPWIPYVILSFILQIEQH